METPVTIDHPAYTLTDKNHEWLGKVFTKSVCVD